MKVYIALMVLFALLAGTEADVAMTEANKTYIVSRHNQLRRAVQPTASNMLKMSWSDEAASNAQKWADASQCKLKHSNSTDRKINASAHHDIPPPHNHTIKCGENIAVSQSEKSWANMIQMWYDEVTGWEYGPFNNSQTVGHFTQVVWYSSYLIGCAAAHCPDATADEYKYFYVCQYCAPGNYEGILPYKEGQAEQSCGDCQSHCDDKLCTNPCPYQDEWNNCATDTTWKCNHNLEKCMATCNCTSGEIIAHF